MQGQLLEKQHAQLLEKEQLILALEKRLAALTAEARDGLGILLMIANDPALPLPYRLKAAEAAADRQYPKLSANMTHATVKRFSYAERVDRVKAERRERERAKLTVHEGGLAPEGGPEAA
jgi:hypothetical protein